MKAWMINTAYFTGGALIGFATSLTWAEGRSRKKYDESLRAMKGTFEKMKNPWANEDGSPKIPMTQNIFVTADAERIEPTAEELQEAAAFVQTIDYNTTMADLAMGSDVAQALEYIEEEEYMEEDGRAKYQIVIYLSSENQAYFRLDGVEIDDWADRIGDQILLDFYKLVPPGKEPILYVRNHKTDEDYEVIREMM